MTETKSTAGGAGPPAPRTSVLGVVFLCVAMVFLIGLTFTEVMGHPVPCSARFLVVAIISLTLAVGSSLMTGKAAARGAVPFLKKSPVTFAVTGGIAVFFLGLMFGNHYYSSDSRCQVQKGVTLMGMVVEATGKPAPGVVVTVDAHTFLNVKTDESGNYRGELTDGYENENITVRFFPQAAPPLARQVQLHGKLLPLDVRLP